MILRITIIKNSIILGWLVFIVVLGSRSAVKSKCVEALEISVGR